MRFGEFSREPLKLLRLEWREEAVECDWLMRPADRWDADLPAHRAEENKTLQALRDGLALRNMIFDSFAGVNSAELRMFRICAEQAPELLMTGSVTRINEAFERVPSITMRARLCGFRFTLAAGSLERMTPAPLGCF